MPWRRDNPLHEQGIKLWKQVLDRGISERQSPNNRKYRCWIKELCDTEIHWQIKIRSRSQRYQTAMIHLLKILIYN